MFIFFLCFSSLVYTAHSEQSKNIESASYLNFKVQPNVTDNLGWWHDDDEQLPLLNHLVSKYFCKHTAQNLHRWIFLVQG